MEWVVVSSFIVLGVTFFYVILEINKHGQKT